MFFEAQHSLLGRSSAELQIWGEMEESEDGGVSQEKVPVGTGGGTLTAHEVGQRRVQIAGQQFASRVDGHGRRRRRGVRGNRGLQQIAQGVETWRDTPSYTSQVTRDERLHTLRSTATLKKRQRFCCSPICLELLAGLPYFLDNSAHLKSFHLLKDHQRPHVLILVVFTDL